MPKKLDRRIKSHILYEIEMYRENKRQLEEYKEDIILGQPLPPDGMPKGSGNGNPTESKAIKLSNSAYIRHTERVVTAIEQALDNTDEAHRKAIDLMYWRKTHTAVGVGIILHVDRATVYRWINEIAEKVAQDLGYF